MEKNGKKGVYKHNGYTDGTFNYYRDQFGWWYAIDPESGAAALRNSTLKKTAAEANTPRMLEAIERVKTTDKYKKDVKKFQALVERKAKGAKIIQ